MRMFPSGSLSQILQHSTREQLLARVGGSSETFLCPVLVVQPRS